MYVCMYVPYLDVYPVPAIILNLGRIRIHRGSVGDEDAFSPTTANLGATE